MTEYRTLLVPYDFSPHARAALSTAIDLGQRLGADLHLLHVVQSPSHAYGYGAYGASAVPPPVDMVAVREGAMQSLQAVADGIEALPKKPEPHVVEGTGTADMIREAAAELSADLIVMGTHGRTGLAHVFLGSVAERTLRCAPCPVLTVQAPDEEAS
jgi:nucleotide-binding universal stress UspA family protein